VNLIWISLLCFSTSPLKMLMGLFLTCLALLQFLFLVYDVLFLRYGD